MNNSINSKRKSFLNILTSLIKKKLETFIEFSKETRRLKRTFKILNLAHKFIAITKLFKEIVF